MRRQCVVNGAQLTRAKPNKESKRARHRPDGCLRWMSSCPNLERDYFSVVPKLVAAHLSSLLDGGFHLRTIPAVI